MGVSMYLVLYFSDIKKTLLNKNINDSVISYFMEIYITWHVGLISLHEAPRSSTKLHEVQVACTQIQPCYLHCTSESNWIKWLTAFSSANRSVLQVTPSTYMGLCQQQCCYTAETTVTTRIQPCWRSHSDVAHSESRFQWTILYVREWCFVSYIVIHLNLSWQAKGLNRLLNDLYETDSTRVPRLV